MNDEDRLETIRAAVFDVWGDAPSVDDIACAVELALKIQDAADEIDFACQRCGGHGHTHPNRLAQSRAMKDEPGPRSRGQSTKDRVLATEPCSACNGSGVAHPAEES